MITIVVPEWFVWLFIVWMFMLAIDAGMNIYMKHLISRLNKSTTKLNEALGRNIESQEKDK